MNIVKPIKEAFREIFPATTAWQLFKFTQGFKELTGKFEEFTSKHGDQIRSTFEGIFSVVDIGWTFVKNLAGGVVDLLGHFTGLSGGILDVTGKIGDWLTGLRDTVKQTDIFGTVIDKVVGFVGKIIDALKRFGTMAGEMLDASKFEGFFAFFEGLWDVIVKIGSKIGQIFAPLAKSITELFRGDTFVDAMNGGIFTAILIGVANFVRQLTRIVEPIRNLVEQLAGRFLATGSITRTLDSIRGCFEAYQNSLNAETIKKIAVAIAILAGAIFVLASIDAAAMDQSIGAITVLFTELMASLAIFTKLDFGGKGMVKGVSAINGLATALLVLAVGMKIMSTMSWGEIAVGIVGTVAGLGALVAAVNLLPEKNVTKSAKAIGKLATALVILAAGMKIMSSLSWQEMGVAITGVVAGLGALVAAVNLLPKDAGARTLGVIGLATAMVILGAALKIMGGMSWNEIGQGLAAMAGSLTAIVLAMNFMPKDMALRSVGMIGLATAMVILGSALKSMGGMSWEEIGRGLTVMGGALVELAIALNFMNGAVAGAGALIIAAGALAILAPVLTSLGDMSWGEIGKGLVALAGAFAVIGIAGLLLTPLVPTLISLAGAMALFGVAALTIGAGVAAVAWGFTALATAGATGATAFVAALGALTVGILGLIPSITRVLGDAVVALCDVIIAVAPKLAETLLVLVSEALSMLATYTPQIVSSLLQFFIGVIDALAANMPQLITSAVNLIGAFFQGVVDALGGLDTSGLIKGIVGVGLMTAMAYALSGVLAILPGAMAGVLGMGVLIAELALVLAAVGALAQIPGLSWLIGEGGDLLQQIGTAIGQFVGGIVGGIAEGATSTLPQVGTNLSNFMTNLQPFIAGLQGIDGTVLDNAKTLASTILALTAADLLSGITSFLTGGNSLADFGTEIVSFGTAMKDFASEVAGLDTATITTSVTAAKDLVKMAGEIPSDGLFGTDGIDDFGRNIVTFGKKMKKYGEEVADIDANSISASVDAARGLVRVARLIPDDGTFGTDGIDNFGDNVVDFAKSLKKYAKQVAGISIESINNSVSAVRSLVSAINSMVGMDSSGVKNFTTAMKDLSKVNLEGFIETFNASTDKLNNVGANMFDSIIAGAQSAKTKFVTTVQSIIASGLEGIESKSTRFKVAGIETISKFINGALSGKDRVSSAFSSALSSALEGINAYRSRFYSAGGYLASGMANGISANSYRVAAQARAMAAAAARAAEAELDINSPSRVGYGIGDFFGIGFVNAIADNVKRAYDASAEMANSAKTGLMNAFDKVSRIISGDLEVQPTISPVVDLTNVRSSANAINGMFGLRPSVGVLAQVNAVNSMMNQRGQNGSTDEIVSAINKLQKALGNVGGTTNNIINGVTYDDGSAINEAVRVIARAALMEGRA
jgi:hypothetical protein